MKRAWKTKVLSALMAVIMVATSAVSPVSAEELAQPAEAGAPVQYKVTVDTAEGGNVKLKDNVELYTPGDTVQMEVETAEGYELSELKTNPELEVDMSNMTFIMPEQDVHVIPAFVSVPVAAAETGENVESEEESTATPEAETPDESAGDDVETPNTIEQDGGSEEEMVVDDSVTEEGTSEETTITEENEKETSEETTMTEEGVKQENAEAEENDKEEVSEGQIPIVVTPNMLSVARASGLVYVGPLTYITTTVGEFTVNGTTAFCMQHLTPTPDTGTSFSEEIYNNADIRKCLYYGWDGPEQWSGFGSKEQGYVVTSLALSYYYDGEDSLGILPDGSMSQELGLADFFDFIESQPDVGSAEMSLSQTNVEAVLSADKTKQVTSDITFNSSERNTITIPLDEGMTLVNRTTGETLTGNATVKGGDTFYLTAPLTKNETWSTGTLYGSMGKFNAVIAVTPDSVQNLGLGRWATDPDHHVELTVKWEACGRVQIQKKDSETGETSAQGGATLQGAQFTVYTDAACKIPATDINGNEVVLTTGADGRTDLSGYLIFGKYYAKETKAPTGYLLSDEVLEFELPSSEEDPTTAHLELAEDVARGGVRIEKWDNALNKNVAEGSATLQGAEIQIISNNNNPVVVEGKTYNKSDVVKTLITGADGSAATGTDVLPYGSYTAKETKAPSGYLLEGTLERAFSITEDGVTVNMNTSDTAIKDNIARGGVQVQKWDNETNQHQAQGGASLQGAKFQISSLNDKPIVVNNKTYSKNDVVTTITTDENGVAKTAEKILPVGRYQITEVAAPEGYLNTGVIQRQFTVTSNGQMVNMDTSGTAIKNDIIRGDLQLVKIKEDVDEEEDQKTPLDGIIFSITSKTTGQSWKITTDENGYASTTQLGISDRGNLVYDTYVIHEENTPEGLKPVNDFEITISEEGRTLYYIMEDKQIISPVTVVKVDSTTGKTIPIADTEFQLLDKDKNVITMTTYYPDKVEHKTFKTDESGSFTFPDKLPYGTYYLRELNAPEGYLLGEDLKFEIKEGHEWDDPIEVKYADAPAMGRIDITKVDRVTGDVLEGAEFTVTAAEDIITPDGTLRASSGDIVDVITTNEDGVAQSKELFLGKYTVEETMQPTGYARCDKTWDVELTYKDQNTEIVIYPMTVENQPTEIIIDKKVTGSEQRLSGVKFAVWNKLMDVEEDGEDSIDPGMTQKLIVKTAGDGQARIEKLAPGTYCIQEVQGVPGYAIDPTIHEVTIGEDGRIEGKDHVIVTVENAETEIVETNAYDAETNTHTGLPQSSTTIRDIVSIENLQPGETYTLKGVIVNQENGLPIEPPAETVGDVFLDRSITSEVTFEATDSVMDVPVEFTFDSSEMDGLTLTVYEYLYQQDIEISNHVDLEDEKQQVTFPDMEIHTTAIEQNTQSHEAYINEAGGTTSITDTVEITGIVPGLDYTLKGVVMDQETGEPLLNADGEEITVEKVITPEESSLTVDMEFVLDSSGLAGKSIVIFEYLYHNDEEIESHEDIDDEDQTVTFVTPEIHTTAIDQDTQSHQAYVDESTVIVDTVAYEGLADGEDLKYILRGTPMDQETGKPLLDADGNQIWSEQEFTAEELEGSVDVTFKFDTSELQGKSIVFYEYLYLITEDGELPVAEHEDIDDEDQTVTFVTPEIHTTAINQDTMLHQAYINEKTVIVDTVAYEGLADGENLKYILRGTPMNQETGKPLLDADGNQIWAEQEFTAEELEGSVDVTFELDTSALAGKSIVFYEYLYLVTEDGELPVTEHEDIEDEDQTVTFATPEIHTTALGKDSGTHEVIAKEGTVIIDTVDYKGIVADGKLKYVLRGTPMEKETGEPLKDADGNQIWVEKEFIPTEPNGSVEMEFTLDTSELNNKSIVFYEYLYLVTEDGEVPVAEHEDINDVNQTIRVKVGSLTATMPGNSGAGMRTVKTGDITSFLPYLVALLLAGTAVTVIVIRKRREGLKEHESQE